MKLLNHKVLFKNLSNFEFQHRYTLQDTKMRNESLEQEN